jgi:peptidoglycan/LPS O-acetylase OafA/YrhL
MYQSNLAYFPFYQHITTYVSGILVGYLILKHNDNKQQVPSDTKEALRTARLWNLASGVGWVLAPTCSCVFMFCTFYWNSADNYVELSNVMRITLAATQRLGWVLGISFITYQCATGRGGPVRKLLSWPALVPLSRLSFAIYLVHLVPILLRAYSRHYTIPWNDFDFVSSSAVCPTPPFLQTV